MRLLILLTLISLVACGSEEPTDQDYNDCCNCLAASAYNEQPCLEDHEGQSDLIINRCWDSLSHQEPLMLIPMCLDQDVCGDTCWFLGASRN